MTDTSRPDSPLDPRDDMAHIIPASGALRKSRRKWRILAFLALAVAVLALFGRIAADRAVTGNQIARIEISGTIASDAERVELIDALAENPQVSAVIVAINSPGGTTAGGEELFEALGRLRAEKPVVAVVNELGASAAYMTAIAADRIFARRLSIVGSIGVLYQHVDAGRLLQTIGVDLDKVASGPLKAEPDIDEAISPEVRRSLEALIGDSYNWFVDIVSERRNLPRQDVLTLADGRIVTGRQGVETGLIDAIGGEQDAVEWLQAEREVPARLPVVTRYPFPDQGLGNWWQFFIGQARSSLGLSASGPIVLDGLVSLWQVETAL